MIPNTFAVLDLLVRAEQPSVAVASIMPAIRGGNTDATASSFMHCDLAINDHRPISGRRLAVIPAAS